MPLPGWDSLANTSAYAKWLTYGTFFALGSLLILEILAHVYSGREATLKEAATARDADNRRADADAHIAEAQRGAAEANTKAEGFRLDIARANERAASANETAERERLARLQLEARLADRMLTPAQQAGDHLTTNCRARSCA